VRRPFSYAILLFLTSTSLATSRSLVWRVVCAIVLAGVLPLSVLSTWRWIRTPRPKDPPGGRPVMGIEPGDRGEWLYSPAADGTTEIELRLRGRRYTAVFEASERPAYRGVIAKITETLNGGVPRVDVNAAFCEVVGREPFRYRGAR
jgi:hypothetical protein